MTETGSEPTPECESKAHQDQKILTSPEVIEPRTCSQSEELAFPTESQQSSILHSSESSSECENQDEQQGSTQLASDQDNSDCSVSITVEEASSQEGKQTVVKPAALVRGRFQRPKPNLRSVAGKKTSKQEVTSEDKAVERENKELPVCESERQQSDEKVLPPEIGEKRASSVSSRSRHSSKSELPECSSECENHSEHRESYPPKITQDTSRDFSGNAVEEATSQGLKVTEVRPAALSRSRFQRPKPNVGRATRRETSAKEIVTENEAVQDATKNDTDAPAECDQEQLQADRKALLSPEVIEKHFSGSSNSPQSKFQIPEGNEYDERDSSQFSRTQGTCPENEETRSQDGEKNTEVKPTSFKSRFQKPKPSIRSASRKEPSKQENITVNEAVQDSTNKESTEPLDCEPEIKQQTDQKATLIFEVIEKLSPLSLSQQSKLQVPATKQQDIGDDSSQLCRIQDTFPENAVEEDRSQEGEKAVEVKPTALPSRFQRPKPSIRRTSMRESSKQENGTETESVQDNTNKESKAPLECKPEVQQADQTSLSPEELDEPSSVCSSDQQSDKLQVPEGKELDEERDDSCLLKTEEDCPKNAVEETGSQEGKNVEVIPTALTSHFSSCQKSVTEKETVQDITKKETEAPLKCEQEQADQKALLSPDMTESQDLPSSSRIHLSNTMLDSESRTESEEDRSHLDRFHDTCPANAVEEVGSQEREKKFN